MNQCSYILGDRGQDLEPNRANDRVAPTPPIRDIVSLEFWDVGVEIVGLFCKGVGEQIVKPVEALNLQRGHGVAGEAHAQAGSPRQVLLASAPYLQELGLAPGDLQENIVVDGALDEAMERLGSGRVLQLGQTAQIRLMFLCEPCAYLEQVQPGLLKRSLGKRGMLGIAIAAGVVRRGDAVTVLLQKFPALSERAGDRFTEFVARIPPGKVVRTTELLLALGLTHSYYRTIPTFLKKAAENIPTHRILAADSSLISRHLPQQMQRLQAEGVEVVNQQVAACYYWQPLYFHDLQI